MALKNGRQHFADELYGSADDGHQHSAQGMIDPGSGSMAHQTDYSPRKSTAPVSSGEACLVCTGHGLGAGRARLAYFNRR
jgi:hypothetical protein